MATLQNIASWMAETVFVAVSAANFFPEVNRDVFFLVLPFEEPSAIVDEIAEEPVGGLVVVVVLVVVVALSSSGGRSGLVLNSSVVVVSASVDTNPFASLINIL